MAGGAAPAAGDVRPGALLTVEAAVDIALADNPGLAEMKARAEAMAAMPPQAGTLPDPVLSLKALNLPTDSFDLSQEAMTQLQIGLSQALPFPGKLALRREAAEHEAQAAGAEVEETRLKLVRDVKVVWWTLFYLDRALEVVASNQELLRQFVTIAQTKYRVGRGLQQDVLLAELELSKLLDLEIRLKSMRRGWEARLNALLNRPADTPARLPARVSADLPSPLPEERLFQAADDARPLITALRSRIKAAQARRDLARKDLYPDFKLGAAYGFRRGTNPTGGERADFASFMFSMNLPVYAESKQRKAIDQRSSELMRVRFALDDARERVHAEIAQVLAEYRQAREQVELFDKGIIPQARQTVASMLAGYQVNKVDFLNLVRSQITLYNYETLYWKALSQAEQALAKLAAAVGKETIHE